MVKKIGVLSLQGNYQKHIDMLKSLNIKTIKILYPYQLDECNALVIPGGESTSISLLIKKNGFTNKIKEFAKKKSILGTCAGMILLSSNKKNKNLSPLCIMNFTVNRNAWGRQIDSFKNTINLTFDDSKNYESFFIRAPKVELYDDSIKILATLNNEPVMLTDGVHYACSFHPELGNDKRVHKYFVDNINV